MSKFKQWLYQRFLPAYCRDDLMEANTRLLAANAAQKQEIDRLRSYIAGLETAMLAVMDQIDTTFAREQKLTNPRIAKYTAKYKK